MFRFSLWKALLCHDKLRKFIFCQSAILGHYGDRYYQHDKLIQPLLSRTETAVRAREQLRLSGQDNYNYTKALNIVGQCGSSRIRILVTRSAAVFIFQD